MSFLSKFLTRRFLFAGAMSGFVSLVISVITGSLITMVNPAHAQNQTQTQTQTIAGRYVPMNKGSTIKDTQTGLIWMRCSVGQEWDGRTCTGEVRTAELNEARTYAKLLNEDGGFAGARNWRVPTVDELQSLRYCSTGPVHEISTETAMGKTFTRDKGVTMITVPAAKGDKQVFKRCDEGSIRPSINTQVFPNTPDHVYWTSSPYVGDSNNAWFIDFYNGDVDFNGDRSGSNDVRLVR